jgi:excisionase family DNA binding protein
MLNKLKHEEQTSKNRSVIYTLKDMANMFHVSVRTIYNWIDDGRFSYVKVGSKTFVTQTQLDEFLQANEVKPFKVGRI